VIHEAKHDLRFGGALIGERAKEPQRGGVVLVLKGGGGVLKRIGQSRAGQGTWQGGQQQKYRQDRVMKRRNSAHRRAQTQNAIVLRLVAREAAAVLSKGDEIKIDDCRNAYTAPRAPNWSRRAEEANLIHRIIPKHEPRCCTTTLTCDLSSAAYPRCQIGCVWFAECDDRQGPDRPGCGRGYQAAHQVADLILVPSRG
jgi:hypothetical protein